MLEKAFLGMFLKGCFRHPDAENTSCFVVEYLKHFFGYLDARYYACVFDYQPRAPYGICRDTAERSMVSITYIFCQPVFYILFKHLLSGLLNYYLPKIIL